MRLIDADALIDWVNNIVNVNHLDSSMVWFTPNGVKILVDEQPTIEPERNKGKWNFIGDQMFECTECGACYTQNQFHQMQVRIVDPEFPNFCPNCGADMREGDANG